MGVIYTVVETALLNGANPLLYIEFLLEKAPDYMDIDDYGRLEELMPWSDAWKAWRDSKMQERMEMWIPPSDKKPHYRPYDMREAAGSVPGNEAVV